MSNDAMRAGTITMNGHNGDEIEAYIAEPAGRGKVPGVVVIHHMPGYDRATKEICPTLAVRGYAAPCPNLLARFRPAPTWPDPRAAAPDAGAKADGAAQGA